MRLERRELLDPRESTEAAADPITGAVNIPFIEMSDRVAELPPREQEIGVVGPPGLVREVIDWLAARGRRGVSISGRTKQGIPQTANPGPGCLWRPNAFLEEILPQLMPGTALDLACGMGREAVFLAAAGWTVTAIDILPDALERAAKFADRYRDAILPIRWLAYDLEHGLPAQNNKYDLITIFRYLHRPMIQDLRRQLRPGGSVLYETFTTEHRQRHGRPSRSADVLEPGELQSLFAGYQIRHSSEAWRGAAHTARVWATLPAENDVLDRGDDSDS